MDLEDKNLREQWTLDRVKWRMIIHHSDPVTGEAEEEEEEDSKYGSFQISELFLPILD